MNLDGVRSYPASTTVLGITIAHQLVNAGKTWKTYQESLPQVGPDHVNYSDGNFTNLTNFTQINPQLNPPLSSASFTPSNTIYSPISRTSSRVPTRCLALPRWPHSMATADCGGTWQRAGCRTSPTSFPTSATTNTREATERHSAISIPAMTARRTG
jgi:hypothetical protein